MLYMAGMIGTFIDKDGQKRDAFVILTTDASSDMAAFHDRQSVILTADEREEWMHSESFMRQVLAREGSPLERKIA